MVRGFTAISRPHQASRWYTACDPQRCLVRGTAYRMLKRAIDMLLCLLSLPLVLPVLGLCAILIWIDSPGPVFFCQFRTGKDGRRFRMYKLRTMVSNAEALKAGCVNLNQLALPDFKIAHDPRVTHIGRMLRRTSLDELPQILNVLRGDMSFVGPRPTSFTPDTYQLWQTARLAVLPGLTGLWQISGRATLDFDQRVRLDLEYIQRQCMWLDFQIMLRTCVQLFRGEGAY
ncbi:MAG TPA: sugar transferase [Roseiflexaceae bacterium]|nr:sugar transferase [Roseiflexaceae bacterium]